jgi:hypothetical protein
VGKPAMLEVGAYQYQLYIVDLFYMIADHAFCPFGIPDKIQLKFFMVVKREIKFFLHTREDRKTIIRR